MGLVGALVRHVLVGPVLVGAAGDVAGDAGVDVAGVDVVVDSEILCSIIDLWPSSKYALSPQTM